MLDVNRDQRGPAIVLLDGLQWADHVTLKLLPALAATDPWSPAGVEADGPGGPFAGEMTGRCSGDWARAIDPANLLIPRSSRTCISMKERALGSN
jgi:hypothetical protein